MNDGNIFSQSKQVDFIFRPLSNFTYNSSLQAATQQNLKNLTRYQHDEGKVFVMLGVLCSDLAGDENYLSIKELTAQTQSLDLNFALLRGFWETKTSEKTGNYTPQQQTVVFIPLPDNGKWADQQAVDKLLDDLLAPFTASALGEVTAMVKFFGAAGVELRVPISQQVSNSVTQRINADTTVTIHNGNAKFVFQSIEMPGNYLGKLAWKKRGQLWDI